MGKMHVKTGDTVVIIAGKDKGKQGKVIAAYPKKDRVVVEGLNQVKRHTKPSQNNPQGGIITKEAPIHVSNVMRKNGYAGGRNEGTYGRKERQSYLIRREGLESVQIKRQIPFRSSERITGKIQLQECHGTSEGN